MFSLCALECLLIRPSYLFVSLFPYLVCVGMAKNYENNFTKAKSTLSSKSRWLRLHHGVTYMYSCRYGRSPSALHPRHPLLHLNHSFRPSYHGRQAKWFSRTPTKSSLMRQGSLPGRDQVFLCWCGATHLLSTMLRFVEQPEARTATTMRLRKYHWSRRRKFDI